jgi:STE24 endopeptidase
MFLSEELMAATIVSIVVVMYGFELVLSLLNYRHRHQVIPNNVKGIYDAQAYQQWLAYTMDTFRFGLIGKTFNTIVLLMMLLLGGFAWVEEWVSGVVDGEIVRTLTFIGVLVVGFSILSWPFSYYRTFVIEERYGFNKTTKRLFLQDRLKNLLLTLFISGAMIALLQLIFLAFEDQILLFVAGAWVVLSILIVAIFVLYNQVFVRFFNKLSPLPDGELKMRIEALMSQVDLKIRAIYLMDASKRSTELNAFFSGLGRTREIVLYDTLVEKLSVDEVLSVLAHELGHAMHKDTTKNVLQQIGLLGIYAAIIGMVLETPELTAVFGLTAGHFGFSLIVFILLLSPISVFIAIPLGHMSRQAEFKADRYSALLVGKSHMASALRKLARENFANLTPHPLYVTIYYTHPPITERLAALEG